ncbi:pilus assembly protein [Methylibium rhizosphaerae]|uniref:pilus assembly protein n=1 Tax=Methylibium rhizosphaerae TaxID=2570323 RepID=UPI001129B60E|nr:PilC/PilY family type IV pilus protein [Methylibium rhizosphaerae]
MKTRAAFLAALTAAAIELPVAGAVNIDLADQPLFSATMVPGNLALALSVEWPTATTPAYPSTTVYSAQSTFLGYFDPEKCYSYVYDKATPASSYFKPHSEARKHACSSSWSTPLWSGNYLNWASMQTLDAFRWVLTGGYRSTDTKDSTILTKTYAAMDVPSVIPDKTATHDIAGATPFTWNSATTRIRNLGTRMYITGTGTMGSVVPYTSQTSHVQAKDDRFAQDSTTYELYINVKVCDAAVGVESNCVQYGTNYKPEGLMQQYADKLRYSAFGYYNHSGTQTQQRDGGVMRARMKFIGPTKAVPGSAGVPNGGAEWSSSTGVMLTNPDADDAKATVGSAAEDGWTVAIANSGVMNYLNKFGYEAKSYKEKDPVSEMYNAALRYFKNLGNVRAYTDLKGAGNSATAAQWLDGFPAIRKWDDPILYSCQKNFILGIGDVNTHRDANLQGSVLLSGLEPKPMPAEIEADTSVNVKTATDMVGRLEGLSTGTLSSIYGDVSSTTCPNEWFQCNSYYVAGLAYDAHTTDIRKDVSGTQTVNTYWMDVLENQVYKHKNQYWLATKYGGFTVPKGFQPYAKSNDEKTLTDELWHTSSDTIPIGTNSLKYATDGTTGTDKRPDNYFPANRPERMREGLSRAFAKMSSELAQATSTAFVTASPNEENSGTSFAAGYDPQSWTGDVTGFSVTFGDDGTPNLRKQWSAAAKLDETKPAQRKIVTCCTKKGEALPFTAEGMGSAGLLERTLYASFSQVPGVASEQQSAANFLNYLRGDRSREASQEGGVYRSRTHLLGDIVNSKVLAVSSPSARYFDITNPGYSKFKRDNASRKTVVYVGANDGMLHAFDGTDSAAAGGDELFAYVPSFTYGTAKTAGTSGLASLGNPDYTHHYFVDASPQVYDIDLDRTGGSKASGDWRSVLISGLGKGGKGYFAIDVTKPAEWTTERAVAEKVLWEFTDERLGYSWGDAQVFKTRKYGWVVAIASGYNNSDGKGYVFFINPRTGKLLEAVATPEGSSGEPINMDHLTAFIPDETDYTADALYVGDLQGNVWRYDLTSTTGSAYDAPIKLAKLTDPSGAPQPVTTAVRIAIEPNSKKRYVFVGTGRLLADSDINNSQVQSLYAIIDGTKTAFHTNATLPKEADFPITRSEAGELEPNTQLDQGIGSAPKASMGWYHDFGRAATSSVTERVTVHPVYLNGIVAVAVNLPSGDACDPAGTSRAIAVNMATGKSVLQNADGSIAASTSAVKGTATDIVFKNVGGKVRLIAGGSKGDVSGLKGNFSGASGLRRLSWREVLTAD